MSNFTFSCFVTVSNSTLSDFGWIVRHPDDPNFDTVGNGYAIAAIVTLFFLLAVPWNLLVIGSIIKKQLYTQPIIMLMLNLALTNLLLALLVMPFTIVTGIRGEYTFGETDLIRCRVCQTGVLNILLPWVSVHTLMLMAVDRFIYLKQPLKYAFIVTPKRTIVALLIIWALCVVLMIPPLFGFGEIRFAYTVATCVPHIIGSTPIAPNYYYIMLMTFEALIPILTLFILYVWIVCIIRSSLARKFRRAINYLDSSKLKSTVKRQSKEHKKSQLRLVWLFGAIFTGNIITWMPMVGLAISAAFLGPRQIPTLAYTIPYLSFLSETVIHPILAVCLIRDIMMMISAVLTRTLRAVCCVFRILPKFGSSIEPMNNNNGSSDKQPDSSMV